MSRSKGHSATAAAAYRAGDRITCEKHQRTHDYRRRRGVVTASVVLPKGSPHLSRRRLWNAAERAEKRKNSCVARELMFSLPVELSAEGRRHVVERMAQHLAARHCVAVDYAIHAPPQDGDPRNHHAHLLMTTRRIVDGELTEKTRELDDKSTGAEIVKEWRATVAALLNRQVEAERSRDIVHVEHRSFADRGVSRTPTTHIGKRSKRLRLEFLRAVKGRVTSCVYVIQKRLLRRVASYVFASQKPSVMGSNATPRHPSSKASQQSCLSPSPPCRASPQQPHFSTQ